MEKKRKRPCQKGANTDNYGHKGSIFPKAHRAVPGGPPGQHNPAPLSDLNTIVKNQREKKPEKTRERNEEHGKHQKGFLLHLF